MEFRLLGPLEVWDGERAIPLGGPKQRAVLAHLLLHANEVVSTDALIDDIWGETPPEAARNSLQTYISLLRKALGGRIEARSPGYVIHIDDDELDALRFERLVIDARGSLGADPSASLRALQDAHALWRGTPLADLADEPSFRASISRLEELHAAAIEDRIAAQLAAGNHAQVIGELENLVRRHPLRERLWAHLIVALYRSSRQADALDAYARLRRTLADELGIDPSPELKRLHEQVLAQDVDAPVAHFSQPVTEIKVFLIADVRGYTRFTQERGDEAGARLAERFASLTRERVEAAGGSVIELRGDGALAVFGSSRQALRAAVQLQERFIEETSADPTLPFGVGIGLDAGEAVPVENGYRGGSLNVAARLCALAAPGEVLASSEVVHLARRVEGARFLDQGPMPLKGIAHPVHVIKVLAEADNPYKGLRAFDEADASDFFGRETLTQAIVARLSEEDEGSRFLAVVGPSGSGKSSVVRAGLIPALRTGALPGLSRCLVAVMTPKTQPMNEFAAALQRVARWDSDRAREISDDARGMLTMVEQALPPDGSDLVLVIDQFEEIFTMVEDEEVRDRFLKSLREAVTQPHCRLRVIVTLRADFYDRPLLFKDFGDLVGRRTQTVTPLSGQELERAISAPAERVGVTLEPGLMAQIVADVNDQPGALPLLQYAITELFEHRRGTTMSLAAYREIGGVGGALVRRAESLYDDLDVRGREAARQLFLRLAASMDEIGVTRRRVSRAEIVSLVEPGAMSSAIEAFGAARLLSFDRDPTSGLPTVEVAHEALLTEWSRLRGWLEAAQEDLRAQSRLSAGAREWVEADRDPSFLLTGSRLTQVEAWRNSSDVAITETERAFLEASVVELDRVLAEQEARQERERILERRSLSRLRALVAVLTAAALLAGGITLFAFDQQSRAKREARVAQARELASAAVANLEVDAELSVLLAIEAVQTTRSPDGTVLREAEEALHRAVVASRVELEVDGVGGWLAWSPAGVFVTEGPENSGLIDIRDADTGERILSFRGHEGDVNHVSFSPDGSKLATTGDDGELKVWDPSTGRQLSRLSGPGSAFAPSFSADGSLVAAAWDARGDVRVLDLSTDRVISDVRVNDAYGTSLSPDGKRVAVASVSGGGAVFDVETGEKVFRLSGGESRVVSWSPDGRYVAAGSGDSIRVWEAATGRLRHTLLGHGGLVWSVAWSPDSSRLVTGAEDRIVKVWEIEVRGVRELGTLSAHGTRSGVSGLTFSPDGTRVMAGDLAVSTVTIWDLGPNGDSEWANLPASGFPPAEFMPDGRRVVTGSAEGSARAKRATIWDLQTGNELQTIGPAADYFWFRSFNVSPDGGSIALGGGSRRGGFGGASAARAWDASTGEELLRFGHELDVNEVSFSPDGEYLATASWDGTAKIVDRSGRAFRVLREDGDLNLSDVAFSPDGRLVATAAFEGEEGLRGRVRIWDWERGEAVRTIKSDISVWWPTVDFDSTGSRIVTAGDSAPVEIWDVKSGSSVAVLAGRSEGVIEAAFSPGGARVATAGSDGTVRLFDADTGAEQLVLRGSGCEVWGVAFSPDGTKLASTSCDGVRIWALDIDDLLEIARQEVGRSLTDQECRQYLHLTRCAGA